MLQLACNRLRFLSCGRQHAPSHPSLHPLAAAAREQVAAAAARGTRIPNRCDLRVYAVTDPDCNAMFGRSNAGGLGRSRGLGCREEGQDQAAAGVRAP